MTGRSSNTVPAPRRRHQFTLGGLVLTVSACACFLGLCRYLNGVPEALMCMAPLVLGTLAFRSARRGPGDIAGVGRWITRLLILMGAAVGLVVSFHLYAVAEFYFLGDLRGPWLIPWVTWHGTGTLVGAGGGALVALFWGARLGRGWTPLFALAVGGSVSLLAGLALLHAFLPEPDDEHGFVDALLWGPWFFALVAGVVAAALLRGFGEHSRRWAARFAAAVVIAGLALALVVLGPRYVRVHGLIVPELASALGAVCLAGVMAGALGAFCGAWMDRRGAVLAPDATADRARRSWLSSGVAWLVLAVLWIAPPLAGLYSVARYEIRKGWSLTTSTLAGIPLIRNSEQYSVWRLERAIERQTVALPRIDRADVIALAEDPGSAEDEPYPFQRYVQKPCFFAVHTRGTVVDDEAEALAQIWRSRDFRDLGASGTYTYLLRFYSRGRLVMETRLIWDGEAVDFDVVEALRWGFGLYDRNAELLRRLDEIAPMPDGTRATLAAQRGSAALRGGEYELALQDLNRALELDPQNTMARESMARLFVETGEYDEAIEQCDTLIELEATEPTAYQLRADARFALGDFRGAIDDYSLVVQARVERDWLPPPIDAWDGRARAYEAIGELEKALADFNAIADALGPPSDSEDAFSATMGMGAEFEPEWSEAEVPEGAGGSYGSPFLPHSPAYSPDPEVPAGDTYAWNRRFYLHRAQVREALGDAEGARADRYFAYLAELGPDEQPYEAFDATELDEVPSVYGVYP